MPSTPTSKKKERTVTLVPEDFKNEMFIQNMAYLKKKQPAIFNASVNHQCNEYKLCSNADGSPNIIHIPTKKLVYESSTMDEFMASEQKTIDNLPRVAAVPDGFIGGAEQSWIDTSPIQFKMTNDLYNKGIFKKMGVSTDNLQPLYKHSTDYLPFITIYGIGLGYHLTELIKQKQISFINIYEPHLDLFYISLYTIPWAIIFKYFAINNKGLNLILGTSPEKAIESSLRFINQKLTPLSSYYYRYIHFKNSPRINKLLEIENQAYSDNRSQNDSGWYEDQKTGLYLGVRNIIKKHRFFSGKKTRNFNRAFVVGSGPSLNATIDFIKATQDDAIIISCGSALSPLMTAGITPDYEVVQERSWHSVKFEERPEFSSLKKITLIKLNVVSPKIDHHYKEILIIQKALDPGSQLLGNGYPVTPAVNPTVTNAGISIAAELGANEVYLFGVDYGAPIDSSRMHAKNTHFDDDSEDTVDEKTCYDLPGNLSKKIRTTAILSWSHKTTEIRIAGHPDIKWFNVGEGALIAGTIPVDPKNLPRKIAKKINKHSLLEEIKANFNNNYSTNTIISRLKTEQMQQVNDYLLAIQGFADSNPKTREEILHVLSILYEAMETGKMQLGFLPTSLISYGFKQYINNVYIQNSLMETDNAATTFFEHAKKILNQYIDDIRSDLTTMMGFLEDETEVEMKF